MIHFKGLMLPFAMSNEVEKLSQGMPVFPEFTNVDEEKESVKPIKTQRPTMTVVQEVWDFKNLIE